MSKTSLRYRKPSFRLHVEELERRDAPAAYMGSMFDLNNQVGDSVNQYLMAWTTPSTDPMSLTLTNAPAGISIDNAAHITGTIASGADVNSPYSVTATATDTVDNGTASVTFNWYVTAGTPVTVSLMNPGSQTGSDNASVNLGLMGTDSAGHALTYSATGLPAGLSVSNSMGTGWITGTIGSNDDTAGPYSVTVTATDSLANVSASQTFTWNVTAGAPVTVSLMYPGSQTNFDNASVNLGLMGTDSAGNALTYSATGLPAGLNVINSMGSGWITGTIDSYADAAGPYSVTVKATDSVANVSASQTFTWTVNWINHAPSFAASDPATTDENADVSVPNWASFNPGAPNESSQTATYTVSNVSNPTLFTTLPSVSPDGALTYTLAPYASGDSTFDVQVRDSGGVANGGIDLGGRLTRTVRVNAVVAPFVVNTTEDTPDMNPGDGRATDAQGRTSLRAAITEANAGPQFNNPYTITFSVTGTISASANLGAFPDLSARMIIQGPGSTQLTIARAANAANFRIFTVRWTGGSIRDLTITNGNAAGDDASGAGGAIAAYGALTLSGVTLYNNQAADKGGALANFGGSLQVNDCNFYLNQGGRGGAIYNEGGTATISNTTIASNNALSGGGMYNATSSQMFVQGGSEIYSNWTTGSGGTYVGVGGGIANFGALTMSNVELTWNTSVAEGGGLFTTGTTNLTDTSIQYNQATDDLNGTGRGGGVYVRGGTTTFVSGCTVSNNSDVAELGGYNRVRSVHTGSFQGQ